MFIIFNKDKILSYLISISTVAILLVLSFAITKNNEEILRTSTNALMNNTLHVQNVDNKSNNSITTMTNIANETQKGYSEAKNAHNN